MSFHSILFERPEDRVPGESSEAPFFSDLNLDQIIDAVVSGKDEYDLKSFFYIPLKSVRAINYRQEIMRELEDPALLSLIESFAAKMRSMREHRAQVDKLHYKYQKKAWFLYAAATYCDAVTSLSRDLAGASLKSRGLCTFREYLRGYAESDRFRSLLEDTNAVRAELSAVHYSIIIKDNSITVRGYDGEIDYGAEVDRTFERFKLGAAKNYIVRFYEFPQMNNVEEKILDFVSRLYPDTFEHLDHCCDKHSDYLDEIVCAFDREIQCYVAYRQYAEQFTQQGLKFCYPEITTDRDDIDDFEGFDLALAKRLLAEHAAVICNDFYLRGSERVFVVTGPNQGGKTTFARTFGQLHYLASLGCPVPGKTARLFLFDRLFAYFEREEDLDTLRGGLEDSLVRIHDILDQATMDSIIIMNEIFTSTTLQDAVFLSKKVLSKVLELDLLCVCVTFIDELAFLSEKTVSVVSTVVPENPSLRTYKIVRRRPDGLAWAISIAEKYRVTYKGLRERLKS